MTLWTPEDHEIADFNLACGESMTLAMQRSALAEIRRLQGEEGRADAAEDAGEAMMADVQRLTAAAAALRATIADLEAKLARHEGPGRAYAD